MSKAEKVAVVRRPKKKTRSEDSREKPKHYRWGKSREQKRNEAAKRWADFLKERKGQPVLRKSETEIREEAIVEWAKFIDEKWDQGFDVYMATFLFNELPGNRRAQLEQMKKEIENFYSKVATRVARKPNSPGGFKLLPFLLAHPDLRGYKHLKRKVSLVEAAANDGLHFHGVIAADRRGKIKKFLNEYFEEHQEEFTTRKLRAIDVVHVTHQPGYVTDYALAAAKRSWFEHDDLIVLPREPRKAGGRFSIGPRLFGPHREHTQDT